MKTRLFKFSFYLTVLTQISCAYRGAPVPLWAIHHGKEYDCPVGTMQIGDPRFPNYFTCDRVEGGRGYTIVIPRR